MENIKEQFARLYMELDLTDDQAAMIKKLQRDVDTALSQPHVSGLSGLLLAFVEHIKKDNELTETVNANDVEAFLKSQQ